MSTINVAEMVKRGMSAEDIQAIIAAEIEATQERMANAEVVAVGKNLAAGGTPTIAEAILVTIEAAKAEMPNVKSLLADESITLAELNEVAVELKPVLEMYDSIIKMSVDMGMTKEDLFKSSGNKSDDQLTAILKGLSR